MGLKLIFLIVTRAVSLLGLSRRELWWKDAEILILRHQLAVALREQPRAHARLTWPDRAWLALLAGTLPVKRLAGLRLIVTPSSILRWHRDILRRRWARRSRCGHTGRPPTRRNVVSLVLRLARENESWGYRRVHGELAALGVTVAPSTVWQILKDAGIGPAPRRDGPGWAEFLRSQAQAILALDFFTAGLLNGTKVHVLAVIEHGSRRIQVLGATEHPVQSWMVQQARNLLMDLDDAGIRARFVLHDRDASFSAAFGAVFQSAGIRVIHSAAQAPRMNSRRLDRSTDYPGASGTEDLIERGGEAGVPVMQHELHPRPGILQVHEQVPGLLDHPRLDRVLGCSEDAYPARAVLYNGKDVDLRSVEQVGGERSLAPGSPAPGTAGTRPSQVPPGGARDRCRRS